jgi:dTDP-4-amino-4,6-dideoxygalactose transaminase
MEAMKSVVESGRFIGGEQTKSFENEFAAYCGCRYGIGTASGSDALKLSLLSLGIGPGDEVVTVSHTFVSTVDAIVHCGATPCFVDVDPDTYTMDPDQLEAAMSPKVKAVLPVHLYGQPADLAPIIESCEKWGASLVEDACQAHGATYAGRKCGSFGRIACFSFYPSKNLGGFGDGGLIVTNEEVLADRLRLLREYGQRQKYRHEVLGFNSRLDEIQAAVLRRKLSYLDNWNGSRRSIAKLYSDGLRKLEGIIIPAETAKRGHVFHIYAIRSKGRDSLREWLSKNLVETGVHYPIPVHLQQAYAEIPTRSLDLRNTNIVCNELLSLPMYPELAEEEVQYVCDAITHWSTK